MSNPSKQFNKRVASCSPLYCLTNSRVLNIKSRVNCCEYSMLNYFKRIGLIASMKEYYKIEAARTKNDAY